MCVCVCVCEPDLVLNNPQRLIRHKTTKQNKTKAIPKLKSPVCPTIYQVFVAASDQTRLDTRSKARRPIKVEIKGRGGRERIETRTLLVSAAHRLT